MGIEQHTLKTTSGSKKEAAARARERRNAQNSRVQ